MPNKTSVFRILVLFTLFSVNLAACNATPALAPAVTLPVETPKPSATATESSTATETPDPNKPDGATDKINGEWVRIVDGVTYRQHEEAGDSWFTSAVLESPPGLPDGVWLMDPNQYVDFSQITFYVYREENVPNFPNIRRLHQETADDDGKYLGGTIFTELFHSRFEQSMSRHDFFEKFNYSTEGISVPFTAPDEKEHIWNLGGPNKNIRGIKFFAIPWSEGDPSTHPEFNETQGHKQFEYISYRWSASVVDGFLIIKGAVIDPSSLSDVEFLEWILNPVNTVIKTDNLQDIKQWPLGYPSDLVRGATTRPSHPFFEIVR